MRLFQTGIGVVAAMCVVTAAVSAQETIRWQADIDAARRLASQSNRLVLIHFISRGCEPCARLETTVFSQPSFVQALEAEFVPVKVNATDFPITAQRFGVNIAPTDVVITPGGQLVCKTGCPQDAPQYIAQLRRITDNYRRVSAETAAANPGASPTAGRPAESRAIANSAAAGPAISTGAAAWGQGAAGQNQSPAPQSQPATGATVGTGNMWAPNRPQATGSGGTVAANPAQSPATPISSPISTAQQAPSNLTAGHTAVAQPATSLPVAQAAPSAAAQPTVALDGYCPVQLIEGQRWTAGDRRFGAVHRGRLYFFAGPMEQQRFMRDPDHFSPMLAGYDAVVWQESGQLISGRREHGVFHDNRVFLFATEESLAKFERNPGAFTTPIEQAMRGGPGVRR